MGAVEQAKRQAADIDRIADQLRQRTPERRGLFVSVSNLINRAAPPDFIVDGLIESDSLGAIFGQYGCGKSLLMFDIGMSVSLGRSVQRRPVKQGPVIYIAGEGAGGLSRRFAAWTAHRGEVIDGAQFAVSRGAVSLLDSEAAVKVEEEIHKLVEGWGQKPVLIVVDTVSRCFAGGNENSSQDMAQFVDSVDRHLRQPFGAAVALVHHTGHEAQDRARGSSVLPAAIDVEYRVERTDDLVQLIGRQARDFAMPAPMAWRIVPVPLVLDGVNVDSVTVEADPDYEPPKVATNAPKQQGMLDLLREEHDLSRDRLAEQGRNPDGARVSLNEWQALGIERELVKDRKRFHDVKKALESKRLIRVEGGYVYPV